MSSFETGGLDDIFAQLDAERAPKKRKHKQPKKPLPERQQTALERNDAIVTSDSISDAERVEQIDSLIQQVQLEAQRKFKIIEDLRNGNEVDTYQLGDKLGMPTRYEDGEILTTIDSGNSWQKITTGELLTDSEWQDKGVSYSVNASRIPLDICQRYVEYWSQAELRKLQDDRTRAALRIDETANTFTRNIATRELADRQQRIEHFGQKVEIMVKNFIEKMSIDNEFDVKVEFGSLILDYEYKIDLMITIQDRRRGVVIGDSPHSEKVGIQLTILSRDDLLEEKEHKAENTWKRLLRKGLVDDVAFVNLDSKTSSAMKTKYNEWLSNKTPGGPDKLLSIETKEAIFRAVFHKMISQEQADEMWSRYQSDI